jgi:hypothetical protein
MMLLWCADRFDRDFGLGDRRTFVMIRAELVLSLHHGGAVMRMRVVRIEQSTGTKITRDGAGNAVKKKELKQVGGKDVEVETDDVLTEETEATVVVMEPLPHDGPSDFVRLATTNPKVARQFEEGKTYELSISPAKS